MSCELFLSTTTGDIWMNVGGTWRIITTSPTVQTITATTSMTTPLLTAAADLRLNPAANVVLDPVGRKILPATNYGISLGSPTRQFLDLHIAELWAETLVAQDVMSTIGGRILVGPTTTLVAPVPAIAGGIAVKHNNLVAGDILLLQNAPDGIPQTEWMQVTSAPGGGPGAYTYNVTRNLDGSGANVWVEGDAVFNTGGVGKGFLDLYALSGVRTGFGPTIVGNVRTGTAFNAISPRWAIGNLNGVGYGHATNVYGIAGGNPAGAFFYTDETNGLVMGGPAGTRVQITPAGVATFVGDGNGMTNINGGSIQTGSITALQLAAGSVTAEEIAAGAITADKVLIGSPGAALNDDPNPVSLTNWTSVGNMTIENLGATGRVGMTAMRSTPNVSYGQAFGFRQIPVDPNKTYRFHVWAQATAGTNGTFYAGLAVTTTTGNQNLYCASAVAAHTTWIEYVCAYGPGTGIPFPAGIQTMVPILVQNFNGSLGWWQTQDIRIEEIVPSTLIQDGAITTAKITAGAITAEKIAAGAITAEKIAAGAITADKITIGGEGAALNFDPGPTNIANWPGGNISIADCQSGGMTGRSCLLGGSGGTYGYATSVKMIPVDLNRTYRAHVWVAPSAGTDGAFYFGVRLLDGLGAIIPSGSEFFYCAAGVILPGGWQEFQCPFGAGTAQPFPTNARLMTPLLYLNFGGTTGYHLVQDIRIEEMTPSTLIKDGAITTAKIIANAINAGHIQAGAISAGHIAANSISASHLQADSVTSAHIQAGTITGGDIAAATIAGGHIAANTITGGNIAANTISADRLNVSTLSAISSNIGTITAGTITGVLIDGVTILAGSGDEVRLDNNGITVSSSGGSGPGAIKIGGTSIWADANALSLNAAQTYARGYLEVQGELYATGAIRGGNGTGSISLGSMAATSASISGAISATSWINTNQTFYAQAMPDAPQYYAVYWEATCKCLYKGAHSSVTRTGARTWTPENPLAILNVPLRQFDVADVIVPRTGAPEARIPGGTFVGLLAEDLVSLAPAAVIRDPQGRPDAIRSEVFDVYLLAAIKAVNDRVPRLEERIQFLEQRLAVLEAARRGGMDR